LPLAKAQTEQGDACEINRDDGEIEFVHEKVVSDAGFNPDRGEPSR
jgi:hypothetical protein